MHDLYSKATHCRSTPTIKNYRAYHYQLLNQRWGRKQSLPEHRQSSPPWCPLVHNLLRCESYAGDWQRWRGAVRWVRTVSLSGTAHADTPSKILLSLFEGSNALISGHASLCLQPDVISESEACKKSGLLSTRSLTQGKLLQTQTLRQIKGLETYQPKRPMAADSSGLSQCPSPHTASMNTVLMRLWLSQA